MNVWPIIKDSRKEKDKDYNASNYNISKAAKEIAWTTKKNAK